MSVGKPPFSHPFDKSPTEVFKRIEKGKFNKIPNNLDSNLADLIKKLLIPNPSKRIGMNGYSEIFTHPYFKNYYSSDGLLNWDIVKKCPFKTKKKVKIEKYSEIPFSIILKVAEGDLNDEDDESIRFTIKNFTEINKSCFEKN